MSQVEMLPYFADAKIASLTHMLTAFESSTLSFGAKAEQPRNVAIMSSTQAIQCTDMVYGTLGLSCG